MSHGVDFKMRFFMYSEVMKRNKYSPNNLRMNQHLIKWTLWSELQQEATSFVLPIATARSAELDKACTPDQLLCDWQVLHHLRGLRWYRCTRRKAPVSRVRLLCFLGTLVSFSIHSVRIFVSQSLFIRGNRDPNLYQFSLSITIPPLGFYWWCQWHFSTLHILHWWGE